MLGTGPLASGPTPAQGSSFAGLPRGPARGGAGQGQSLSPTLRPLSREGPASWSPTWPAGGRELPGPGPQPPDPARPPSVSQFLGQVAVSCCSRTWGTQGPHWLCKQHPQSDGGIHKGQLQGPGPTALSWKGPSGSGGVGGPGRERPPSSQRFHWPLLPGLLGPTMAGGRPLVATWGSESRHSPLMETVRPQKRPSPAPLRHAGPRSGQGKPRACGVERSRQTLSAGTGP